MKRLSLLLPVLACISFVTQAMEYVFQRDINYRDGEEMCNLDVAYFMSETKHPVVVWLHGGGLTGGSKEVPEALLADSIVVVGVEYRLSPAASVDEIIDDAAAAVAWTFANIVDFNGDSSKVFVAGHSAGGYLADMIALDKSRLEKYAIDADSIAGVIPFSGQCITHFEARNRAGISALQPTIDSLAPLYHVRRCASPFLIISAGREKELYGRYEEQAYFWRMMKLAGNEDVTLLEMDGYDHGGMPYPAFPLLVDFVKNRCRVLGDK